VSGWDARGALVEQRSRVEARLADLLGDYTGIVEASADSNADDEHDPEGSTIAFERSQVGALVAQTRAHLAEIDAALTRLSAGTYGVCERCGGPIAPERLEARPVARTCITCASRTG
jgi:DnaK suppressor protein